MLLHSAPSATRVPGSASSKDKPCSEVHQLPLGSCSHKLTLQPSKQEPLKQRVIKERPSDTITTIPTPSEPITPVSILTPFLLFQPHNISMLDLWIE